VGGYAAQVGDAQVLTSYSFHTLQVATLVFKVIYFIEKL
jgi:hypothetical protein